MPTPLPGAFISPWILPRAIKQSTGLFDTPVCGLVPPFRIPIRSKKEAHPNGCASFLAEDEGFKFGYLCPLVARTSLLVSLSSDIFL